MSDDRVAVYRSGRRFHRLLEHHEPGVDVIGCNGNILGHGHWPNIARVPIIEVGRRKPCRICWPDGEVW